MTVETKIDIYEKDGQEVIGVPARILKLKSHWNRDEMVVIDLTGQGEGEITVSARDLRKALERCSGWRH